MKRLFALSALVALSGCGLSSRNNEVIGQVKRVISQTPIVCPDRTDVDLSLGVIKNGVGSMSSQDKYFTVNSSDALDVLKKANESGAIVKITYNERRLTWCQEDAEVTKAELVN